MGICENMDPLDYNLMTNIEEENNTDDYNEGYIDGKIAEYNRIIGFLKWHRYAIVDSNGDYYSIEELEEKLKEQNNE